YGLDRFSLTEFNFAFYRDHNTVFEAMAAYDTGASAVTGRGEAERVTSAVVTYNFFDVLGARPTLGRWFVPEEDRPGRSHPAVLSYRLWQRKFSGAREIVGTAITVDGEPA